MKLLKWVLAVLLVLLVAAAALFWFLPASWVVGAVESRMHGMRVEGVSGTLWNGHAERVVTADGELLGMLDWTLNRGAPLGRRHVTGRFQGPLGHVAWQFDHARSDSSDWRDIDFRWDARVFASHPALRAFDPRGTLEGRIPEASLQGNWPVTMHGEATWRDASLQMPEGRVPLGNLHVGVTSNDGVLHAKLDEDGSGPLDIRGTLDAMPLGWRLDIRMQPRTVDTALSHLLARFGPPSADGSTIIHRQAGLAPAEMP
ncbi:MAG TPA: type II secretion system protein N [Luteibacter sp.]|nr:type II secretion system protein N [Luteibacter sp.]